MRLRDVHFFRRVPADVSEATKTGGVISIVAILTICWLVLTQYREYATSQHVTQLRLDNGDHGHLDGGSAIRINFNVTMTKLPCQYASVHVADHVGAHKMDGQRNVHKVRLSKEGMPLGMYEPHKYADPMGNAEGDMASHVFPWHKKERSQGDVMHRMSIENAHLSADQKQAVGQVEHEIRLSGKGAQAGRRLLAIDNVQPAAMKKAVQTYAAPDTPMVLSTHSLPDDTSPSCESWASQGECISNSGYMLSACATSCKGIATAVTCDKWFGQGRCRDASDFMLKMCTDKCGRAAAETVPVSLDHATGDDDASQGSASRIVTPAVKGGDFDEGEDGGAFLPLQPFRGLPAELSEAQFSQLLHSNAIVMANFYAPWCFWSNRLTPAWDAVSKRLHVRAWSQVRRSMSLHAPSRHSCSFYGHCEFALDQMVCTY